ncbi:hypothetical protein [Chitinivorax sp. B]|uniref:hypothetical protein n=1 Tax=Chitinivorax sp. B TaxID=2502235 RepID=UPI0010F72B72|nr:hypothetical protein [Chitinivorax sp. B]
MTPETRPALFSVTFDINQNTQNLVWHVESPSHRDAFHTRGRAAGTLKLIQDELIKLQVTAGSFQYCVVNGKPVEIESFDFEITQCAFIARPSGPYRDNDGDRISETPSLIANSGSITMLDTQNTSWATSSDWSGERDRYLRITRTYQKQLPIVEKNGFWELSFLINVNITRHIKNGPPLGPECRVFSFDPESEVGSGTHR